MVDLWELVGGAAYTSAVFALGRLSANTDWAGLFETSGSTSSKSDDNSLSDSKCAGLLTEIRQELDTHTASTRRLNEQLDSADHESICDQAKATRDDNTHFQKFLDDRCSQLEQHSGKRGGDLSILLENLAGHRERAVELDGALAKLEDPEQLESAISPLRDCIRDLQDHNRRLQGELEKTRQAVAQQSQRLEQAKEEARVDALTGLPNRRAFDERIAQAHAEFTDGDDPYVVALLDVDHFKRFNDEHGHATGDRVLEVVAKVLRRSLRGTDHVARFGGEEFVILLQRVSEDQAMTVIDRHRERVAKASLMLDGKNLSITVSAGVAEIRPGESISTVLERADQGLYAAKAAGRNQTCRAEPEPDAENSDSVDVEDVLSPV